MAIFPRPEFAGNDDFFKMLAAVSARADEIMVRDGVSRDTAYRCAMAEYLLGSGK